MKRVTSGTLASVRNSGLDSKGGLRSVIAKRTSGFVFARLKNGVQYRMGGVTKNVLFYDKRTVRVNACLGKNRWKHPSIVVIRNPASVTFKLSETADTLTLASDELRLVVDKTSGAVSFFSAAGRFYTKERNDCPQTVKSIRNSGGPTYEVSNTFTLKPEEAIYGFGYTGAKGINRRGKDLLLVQTNTGIVVPMMVSTERYGIMWDVASKMTFKDDLGGATLWAESAPGGVDYYFFGGESMDDVIAEYRNLTGAAPMYPKHVFGLFMSKERYKTQDDILKVAHAFRRTRFPLDYIVQDWQYWGGEKDGTWSGMIWDKERYPDPTSMIRELHDMHVRFMVSIWPAVGNDTELAHELDTHRLRFKPLHWLSNRARIFDAYSEKGRQIYFYYVKRGLLDKGVDSLWIDATEVEVGPSCGDPYGEEREIKSLGRNAMGDFTRYLNSYTLMATAGLYEGQRAISDKRVFTLSRSAWSGSQRTAAASWSGDILASWETLRAQIEAGLSVVITGNPYWTQDTGGFFVPSSLFPGGEKNRAYRELYARWFQFAVFNPITRIHGTDTQREPYLFKTLDTEIYDALLNAAKLRYSLLPYIYSLSWQVTNRGYTLMRLLSMDFPDDSRVRDIDDSFMFGPSFLVHPVTKSMCKEGVQPMATIPVEVLRTDDRKQGLSVQYFEGTDFNVPAGKTIDQRIEHDWPLPPQGYFPPGLKSLDFFSARWEGTITPPEDGAYEIGIEFDDGGRLFLNDELVVEDWRYGPKRYKGKEIYLGKGRKLRVKAEFQHFTANRFFRLVWRTPKDAYQPVRTQMELNVTMETCLPQGTDWYDFWNNERLKGGQTVKKDCPLDVFPLYVRAGSIMPIGPVVQYATDKSNAPYEIRIFPGADAKFVLYEDDNETYAYERGERSTCDLVWTESTRTLQIGARQGSFVGMVKSRVFDIVIAEKGRNAGIGMPVNATKSVYYSGKPITEVFPF